MTALRWTRLTVTALLGAVTLAGCAVDRYDAEYADVFDAKAEDAVDRGWVPEWMPESASDIRTSHLPLDGASILSADLGSNRDSINDACELINDAAGPALSAPWFDTDAATSGETLQCDDNRFVVVDGDRLYAWTPKGVTPTEPE